MTLSSKVLVFAFITFLAFSVTGQDKILHYSETSGYDHQTRTNSLTLFQNIASSINATVVNDTDGSSFDTLSNLLQFDLIVFSNTSGNAILDSNQRNHFELYIQNGGSLLGIHAATDTYRHSNANGHLTGSWDFYAQTIGGSVQENPNHVSGTPNYAISSLVSHPVLDGIPMVWNKNEEYYYWENGYLDSNNINLLEVEQTVGPNSLINSYDSPRTVAWYKTTPTSRIFYTSLGHSNSNYTSDTIFQKLIQNATEWCLNRSTSLIETINPNSVSISPNPVKEVIFVNTGSENFEFKIYSMNGKLFKSGKSITAQAQIDVNSLPKGIYLIYLQLHEEAFTQKFIVQ